MINYEDFQKVELKVAKIIEVERVEGSEKLLRFQVELGEEKRQILSGIGRVYEPQDLVGKEVVIVSNLEPRSLMGFESQGMILAADGPDGPVVLMPEKEVVSGSIVK